MKKPSESEILELADELGISFSEDEVSSYTELVGNAIDLAQAMNQTEPPRLPPRNYKYPRGGGYQPDDDEDPYNAWITKCHIEGASDGSLNGMTVGLKDNISLAGIELTNGSDVMQGYVPAADATVAQRLLDAGATILGKNNMWSFSLGPSDYGQAMNPKAPEYSIGGSSSGTATAVAAEEVDIGIGGDQAGSIRIPASFGGLVGLKPTHGLVPYTGIFGADPSQDHTGPITRNVRDAALALEVIAGYDGLDHRQTPGIAAKSYTEALNKDVSELSIGVLKQGFGHDASHPEINEVVRNTISELESIGVNTTEVSIPAHLDSIEINAAITEYGSGQTILQNGFSHGLNGWYDTNAIEYLGRAVEARISDLPAYVLGSILSSEYLRRNYHGAQYAKAQNLTLEMQEKYNEALSDVDALVTPTLPIKPPSYGDRRTIDTLLEGGERASVIANTAMFDFTHHPAMTVPCGTVDETPVGIMFVGEHFDEMTLFQLAHAYEQQSEFNM